MTRTEFAVALEQHLQRSGRAFDRSTVLALVADCWPLSEEHPDAGHWAREFIKEQHLPSIEWVSGG